MALKTQDSTLAYFVNQLDNLDRTLHEPLYSVTWSRDIKLREGVTMANESTSFLRTSFGATGGLATGSNTAGGGKNWISPNSNDIAGVDVNGERIVKPLRLWGQEVSFSSVELDRSQLLGQPVDVSKMKGLTIKYNMDIDEQVYIGDDSLGVKGLLNSTEVTFGNVALNAATTSRLWSAKTPDEILADVNTLINSTYSATGFAVCPSDLLLPPAQFAYLASQKVSTAGNVSILTFLEDNSLSLRINGKKLNIQPVKWLTGRGAGSTDRMVAYTNDGERVRFPLVPIRRETAYYQGIKFAAPYISALGEVEFVYPETVQYADGI
jgi:hypothetical protein